MVSGVPGHDKPGGHAKAWHWSNPTYCDMPAHRSAYPTVNPDHLWMKGPSRMTDPVKPSLPLVPRYSRRAVTAVLGATPLLFLGGSASGQAPPKPGSEAEQIALDAYIYGYSLITTEVTRVQMSNVDKIEGMHAPMAQFANIKTLPAGRLPRRYRRPTPIRSIRWRGSTSPNRRYSAIRTWASVSTCSR